MQTINQWAVPFYYFKWDEHEFYKNALKTVCDQQQAQGNTSGVAPEVKSRLYESRFDFCTIKNPAVEKLTKFMQDSIFQSAKAANERYWNPGWRLGVAIDESWCHITQTHGHHDHHCHPNHSWSAVYYLDVGECDMENKSGLTRFYRPWETSYQDPGTLYVTDNSSIDINCQDGMLFVFPSWIMHSQLPYRGAKDRYVIAVNAKIIAG